MIRKPPLRTYQKKKGAQSSFSYSHTTSREPHFSSKRTLNKTRKSKHALSLDDVDIEELSSAYFETTFDRIAKNARLPTPPVSYNSIVDISSDVPPQESSFVRKNVYELSLKGDPAVSGAGKRVKRKLIRSRAVHQDTEVIVKKRLKHDLINVSTKKSKTVRNAKRKVSAQSRINASNAKAKLAVQTNDSTLNNSENWFVPQPKTRNRTARNKQNQKNSYLLRMKGTITPISDLSLTENNISQSYNAKLNKVKNKPKKKISNRINADRRNLKVLNYDDTLPNDQKDFPEFEISDNRVKDDGVGKLQGIDENKENLLTSTVSYEMQDKAAVKNSLKSVQVENFQRHSTSQSSESDSTDSNKYRRILNRKAAKKKIQTHLIQKSGTPEYTNAVDNSNNISNISRQPCSSTISEYHVRMKKDFVSKPRSYELLNCSAKEGLVLHENKFSAASEACNTLASEDLFQTSISNTASNIEPQSDGIKPCTIEITDCENKKLVNTLKQCDTKHSLYYLKCSTPISAYVTIDRSMNRLSPITLGSDMGQRIEKFPRQQYTNELSVMNSNRTHSKIVEQDLGVQRVNARSGNVRRKLNVSYKEDDLLKPDNQYWEQNDVRKKLVKNSVSNEDSSHGAKSAQVLSPTSRVQESLEILKLDSENSNPKLDEDHINNRTHSTGSGMISENTNKYENTSEFTGKSKDTHAHLTPIGIITTRSGRQLKLSMTMKKKFFNDSNDPKIHSNPGSDLYPEYEIIDNSENPENCVPKIEMVTDRAIKCSELQSPSKPSTICSVDGLISQDLPNALRNVSAKISVVNMSNNLAPSNSKHNKSVDIRDSSNCKVIPEIESSEFSLQNCENQSRIAEGKRNNTSVYDETGSSNITTALSNREISQSIVNSTKNFNSLSIRSNNDSESESLVSFKKHTSVSDMVWSTITDGDNSKHTTSNTNENTGNISMSDSQESSISDDDSSAEWSTISNSEHEPHKESTLSNELSNSLEHVTSSNETRLDEGVSTEDTNEASKSTENPSLNLTDIDLSERLNLLSSRINMRQRRKRLLKLEVENMPQVDEEPAAVPTTDDTKLIESFGMVSINASDSRENYKTKEGVQSPYEARPTDLFVKPMDVNLKINWQPLVLIEKLKEPIKVAASKKQSCSLELSVVREMDEMFQARTRDSNESNHMKMEDARSTCNKNENLNSRAQNSKRSNFTFNPNATRISDSDCVNAKMDVTEPGIIGRQSVFLKPGKEWTRSLSILNSIQDKSDLDILSTGKGKKWRNSVQAILDMQQQRLIQSCLGKNEDDKETEQRSKALDCTSISDRTTCTEVQSIGSASPSRFIRRMSIRVVPENKKLSHIEDTSFLEAYGISASKSRKTLSQRSNFNPDRKTLVANVQCEAVEIETIENENLRTARDVVLQRCCQKDYLPFTESFPEEYMKRCRKIGEGVYGEVFLYDHNKRKSVIKIIPIEGNALVNGERQKKFDEILSEIVIAKELHNLRNGETYQTDGFVEVKNIRCIIGKYPEKLIELWKAYDDDKGSDNDCPSMFDENQLYIVLELGHGGQDLEAFVFQSAVESHALFVQTALALAVAEQSLEFEHRDLHWGNILISHTKDSRVAYKLNDKVYTYPTRGMQVAIIDFTLSRMSYEGCCIFNDLALDPALFTAQGEYQFEIYRMMQDKIGNDWQKFEPYTNILWLHYVLDKMITALRYKRQSTKVHKEAISRLQELKDIVLDYESAFDFVTNCEKITNLQCKRATLTTVKSSQVQSDQFDPEK
ncbi:serine-rich adhesin for platelets isoform X2 [Diprion similis]|uniref:serine-rich adhesin for platelets isoform X2 n=1 Tax=Diprion similis TaxID=362088 RepID=UPI001EF98154|nr:serine-rich adhesin for platelets isoform X2 [Diprion similis]